MTEKQAIKYVQRNARYYERGLSLPSGKKGGKYAVEFGGQVIHSNDTRRLVTRLVKFFGKGT